MFKPWSVSKWLPVFPFCPLLSLVVPCCSCLFLFVYGFQLVFLLLSLVCPFFLFFPNVFPKLSCFYLFSICFYFLYLFVNCCPFCMFFFQFAVALLYKFLTINTLMYFDVVWNILVFSWFNRYWIRISLYL